MRISPLSLSAHSQTDWAMMLLLARTYIFNFNVENVIIRGCKWNEAIVTENVTVCDY
jgi:hypothetical protein